MRLPHRIASLTPGGDGWDLFREAQAMKRAGRPIVDLTIGEHDVRTDPAILAAMHEAAAGGHTGYAAVPGTSELRAAVARRVAERTGVPTGPENVLVTPGGQAALFAAHMVACDPGARAAYVSPHYATYPGTIRAAGALPVEVPARPEAGFVPAPADIAATGASSVLVNTPGNPTGIVYDRAAMEGIAEAARDLGAWAISDEVYDTMVWEGEHVSLRALPEMAERTLVVGSMSKSHAMTGSRIGWLVGPAEAIGAAIDLATHTTYGVPGFIQDAALFALSRGRALEERIAAPFRRRRDLALRVLDGRAGLRPVPPQGAMYLMVDIRETGLSGEAFGALVLRERGVAVMPGESFGRAEGHLRVALTVEDGALERALGTMADLAGSLVRSSASAGP